MTITNKIDPVEDNLTKTQAQLLRKEIKTVSEQKVEIDLEFCKKLFYSKAAYVQVGDETIPFYEYCKLNSWKEYVEKEIGITIGKARRYAAVYAKYFIELEKFNMQKHAIDFSKLELLMPIISDENLDNLISVAREADIETLQSLLGPKKKGSPFISLTFRFKKQEDKVVNKAIKKARKSFGTDLTEGQLFVAICTEYLDA